MSEGYVKILSSILRSSIWKEPDDVRLVWITMLAMADRDGFVASTADGIAHETRTVSEGRVEECLSKFQSPDLKSRTEDFEGRRVQKVDRGWLILNYKKFRDMHGEESKKAAKRRWWDENKSKPKQQQNTTDESLADSSGISSHGSVVGVVSEISKSDARPKTELVEPKQLAPVKKPSTTGKPRDRFLESFQTQCPDRMEFTEAHRGLANRGSIDINLEWRVYSTDAQSKSLCKVDWNKAFESHLATCISKIERAAQFRANGPQSAKTPPVARPQTQQATLGQPNPKTIPSSNLEPKRDVGNLLGRIGGSDG
jgi:hypothetical protein